MKTRIMQFVRALFTDTRSLFADKHANMILFSKNVNHIFRFDGRVDGASKFASKISFCF